MRLICTSIASCALIVLAAPIASAGSGYTYINESNFTEEADAALLAGPAATQNYAGYDTEPLRGAIFESKVTEIEGESLQVIAEVGYGPLGSDPRFSPDWQWSIASFDLQLGSEDNYTATLLIDVPGEYSYTYRFSLDGGNSWTLADLDGAGSNIGYDFDPSNLGTITVLEAPITIDFAHFKTRYYDQTGPAAPVDPQFFAGDQRIFGYTLTPETVGTAEVTFPGANPPIVPLDVFAGTVFVIRFLEQVATEALLDEQIPPGEYSFRINGGILGEGTGSLVQPAVNRWTNIPQVVNYNALQGVASGAELVIDYNTPVTDPGATSGGVFYGVFDPVALQYVAFGVIDFAANSQFTVPAGALSPARRYDIEISFSGRDIQSLGSGALGTATGFTAWDSVTRASFRTAPACPGDANGDGIVNFSDITSVLANFGNAYGPGTGTGDANGDGAVNFSDITTVLANFGNSCI
jgi:hypothetical protein